MQEAISNTAAAVRFWDDYAPWYERWLEHNAYHTGILSFAGAVVKPGWRVLDIGAGSGVLSIPLARLGCRVTALEPSETMRGLLKKRLEKEKAKDWTLDERPWEETPEHAFRNQDFVVACNSLHLTSTRFDDALEKVFRHRPKRVLVLNELGSSCCRIPLSRNGYFLCYGRVDRVRTAFVYRDRHEAIRHWTVMHGRSPRAEERETIDTRLVRKRHRLWMVDEVLVGLYYWRRYDGSRGLLVEKGTPKCPPAANSPWVMVTSGTGRNRLSTSG